MNPIATVLRLIGIRNRLFSPKQLEEWARNPRTPFQGEPPRRLAKQVRVRRNDVAGWPVYEVEPLAPARVTCGQLLYLHGGGYVLDFNPALYWGVVAGLATATGRTVTVPIYPVAPEHGHRDAYAMLIPLYQRLLESHRPDEIAFAGDSAGGGLALGLCHLLREHGLPQPSDCVLLSPWLDLTLSNPAIAAVDRIDPLLNAAHLRECGRLWAGGESLDDPKLSPVNAPLRGLAKLAVFTGTLDVLNPDARVLRDRAAKEGVELVWRETPGAIHVWMFGFWPSARAAFREIGSILAAR